MIFIRLLCIIELLTINLIYIKYIIYLLIVNLIQCLASLKHMHRLAPCIRLQGAIALYYASRLSNLSNIDEDGIEKGLFDPYIVSLPNSTTNVFYQALEMHHPNANAQGQPTS